jgi:WD40 repeat protein
VTDRKTQVVAQAQGLQASVTAISWNPNSGELASSCAGYTICGWKLETAGRGSLQYKLNLFGHNNTVTSLAWSSDGNKLASTGDDTVRIWTVTAPDKSWFDLDTTADKMLGSIGLSSDRRLLAAGSEDGSIYVWNVSSLVRERIAPTKSLRRINFLAWAPENRFIGASKSDGSIDVRGWPNKSMAKIIAESVPEVLAFAWLPKSNDIVTAGADDGVITIRPIGGEAPEMLSPKFDHSISGLVVTADGHRLLAIDVAGTFGVWNLPTRRLLSSSHAAAEMTGSTVNLSNGQDKVVFAGNSADILIYRLNGSGLDGPPIRCHSASRILDDAVFGRDDKFVYAIGADAVFYAWSLSDRCELSVSAPIPGAVRPADSGVYRHRILMLPELNSAALMVGGSAVRIISLDVQVWRARAGAVGYSN